MKTEKESRQMYLKTILTLETSGKRVRKIDIARAMGYSKPSVTTAVQKLEADGMLIEDSLKGILLTPAGQGIAREITKRYNVLKEFWASLGAEKDTAEENACRLEHLITDDLFALIETAMLQKGEIGFENR